jgi:GAF domain-containing protein/HAMP domain-containing protein
MMLLEIQWSRVLTRISKGGLHIKIIAWSFVPTAIILAAVAWVTLAAYQRVTEDLVIERGQELTRLSTGEFAAGLTDYTGLLTEYTGLLADLAHTATIYTDNPAAQRDALQRARHRFEVFDGGVLILNNQGTVVAAEPERKELLGQNWSNRSYFRQMLRTPGPVFSNIVTDGPGDAEVIAVVVPIKGDQGQFLGIITGMFQLNATSFSSFYGDIGKLRFGENSSAYLVDGHGRVIYHTDPGRIGQDFSTQTVVQDVLRGQGGAIRTQDFAGRAIVASFAPVPGTPWGLVTEESWAELIRPSRGYRQFLVVLLVLGVLVPALVVAVGIRRITSPITELIGAAQAVAGGDFGQTITASTGDEIEDLAEQFNRMSAQLQISYSHLERMVAERTKELATLSAIAAVVSRSLDLEEILSDALDKSLQVMEVEAGAIYLLDNEAGVLTVAAQRGFSPEFVAGIDKLKMGEGFSGRVAQSGQPLVVRDVSTDPRLTRVVVRDEGLRSLACVPTRSKGKVLGVLFAVTRGYREFADQDVELLTAIGHQIGVAIENARLFEAERWRQQQATLLAEMAKLTSGTLDLGEVLHLTAEYAVDIFNVDHYLICLCDGPGDTLRCAIEKGFSPQVSAAIKEAAFHPSDKTRQVVLEELQPLIIDDTLAVPHLVPQGVTLPELQSVLVVPIEVGGRRLGIMLLGTQQPKQRRFTADEGELALAMANQTALAIESARLFKAEQRRSEQFQAISEVGRRLTSILDIDEVLAQIVRLIRDTFDYYHVAIGLIEEDDVVYRVGAGKPWDDPDFEFKPARLKVGQEGVTGWVAGAGEPLLVPDVSQEPRYVWMEDSKTRSELTVPLKAKGEIIGVLDVQSDQLDAFDASDLLVLQSLAHQAGAAIENARLFEAEQRRVEQFRVIGEVGQRITSILAIDELLHQIANLIQVSFNHYLVEIGLVENGDVVLMTRASREQYSPFQTARLKVGQEGIIGWVAATGEPLMIRDVSEEPRYIRLTEVTTRSELAIPIKAKGKVIGVVNVESDQFNAFDETDVTVLQSLANQAGVAIENARLLAAERRRADELDALRANAADISAELELSDLLGAILERAVELLGVTVGELGLYNESTQDIRIVATYNMEKDYTGMRIALGEGAMGRVAASREPLIVQDYHSWEGHMPQYAGLNWHSTLVVPLMAAGQLVGTVAVGQADPTRQFGPADLHLLDLFAQQAAIAVRNAQLYEQAQQVAVLEERQRLARDLHDSATQSLYAVTMFAEAAARLLKSGEVEAATGHMREVRETAQEALQEMRLLIFELRPPILEEEGLVTALQTRLEMVEGRSGLEIAFNAERVGDLSPEIEEGLYRIAQEVLNNILKHAQAQLVTVHLCRAQQKIILEIADDGIGFDPATIQGKGGLGLEGMEERVALLGGQLLVSGKPGEGTTVRVEVSR